MIDSRIPMMVQTPNILAAMASGTENAANQANVMRTAELQNLYRQQGPGLMAGDPAAFNALARIDAPGAVGLRTSMNEDRRADTRLGIQQEELSMLKANTARAIAEAQDKRAAEAEARQAQQLAMQAEAAFRSGDAQTFGMISREFSGGQPLEPTEDNLRRIMAIAQGGLEGLQSLYAAPEYGVANGVYYDKNNPGAGARPIPGMPADKSVVDFSGANIGGQTAPQVGTIPQGYQLAQVQQADGSIAYQMAPIPGGPADTSREDQRAGEAAATNEQTRSNVVLETTRVMREMLDKGGNRGILDLPEVGIVGDRLARWGVNQEAVDMGGLIDTLQGMVAFDRLEKMKSASATGASGLGQVTEREIALLSAQLGALKQNISPPALKRTLDTIESVFGKLSPQAQAYLTGQTDAEPWRAGGQPAPVSGGGPTLSPEDAALLQKYGGALQP